MEPILSKRYHISLHSKIIADREKCGNSISLIHFMTPRKAFYDLACIWLLLSLFVEINNRGVLIVRVVTIKFNNAFPSQTTISLNNLIICHNSQLKRLVSHPLRIRISNNISCSSALHVNCKPSLTYIKTWNNWTFTTVLYYKTIFRIWLWCQLCVSFKISEKAGNIITAIIKTFLKHVHLWKTHYLFVYMYSICSTYNPYI